MWLLVPCRDCLQHAAVALHQLQLVHSAGCKAAVPGTLHPGRGLQQYPALSADSAWNGLFHLIGVPPMDDII